MARRNRRIVSAVVVAAVAVAVAAGLALTRNDDAPATTGTVDAAAPPVTVAAPTSSATPPAPTASATTTAGTAAAPPGSATETSPPGREVPVALGYAEWDPAGRQVASAGFVAGAVEEGGTCTLVLTRGATAVQTSAQAEPDATTTNCGRLTVPGDQLVAGEWEATLAYRSASSHGVSQPLTVSVPAA